MKLVRRIDGVPPALRGCVVAIGNFDGVHRGHRMVLEAAQEAAAALDGRPVAVFSFEPHPRQFFRPEDPPFRLTPFRVRARLLEALGVDLHVVQSFDEAFSRVTAEAFIQDYLLQGLGARHVVIGYDFHFGHRRQGNSATLAAMAETMGFGMTIVTAAGDEEGGVYSSSRIRNHLREGEPEEAARLLGRFFAIEGRVEPGDQRGRTIGFPTANLSLGEYIRPRYGVYAVRCITADGTRHEGVASLGVRPMWRTPAPMLEAHLFDFDGDLYGRHLCVELVRYLRPEERFDSIETLVAQMRQDSERARETLRAAPA